MAIQNNNTAMGIPANSPFRIGESNVDDNREVERGVSIPWASDPANSYVYYDCTVGVMLDSGIVVHNKLPQVDNLPDTLASVYLDANDLETITDKGVNLTCNDQYQDIVQRMGHSRYWFRIWGQALRVGYKVPIPGIKVIGGVPAIPYDRNPQWGYNRIFPGANYSGVILWHAQWSLWYTIAVPPVNQTIPSADPSAHIRGDTPLPQGIQAAFSQADDEALPTQPGGTTINVPGKPLQGFITR